MANGKMAMKFKGEDADDRLIAVATWTDANDVLLATRNGRAIRSPVGDARVFSAAARSGCAASGSSATSPFVKEIGALGGDVSHFVSPRVAARLLDRHANRRAKPHRRAAGAG